MRIGFTGASGTGKTTSMKIIAQDLDLEICPIGSREIAKEMGFSSPYDVDKAGLRKEFQYHLFEEKSKWESENENWISDRTVLDNYVYTLLHDPSALTQGFRDSIFSHLKIYDLIFFFPVEVFIKIGNDVARKDDMEYHKLYDWLLRDNLYVQFQSLNGRYNDVVHFIHTDILEDRVDFIKEEISEYIRRKSNP